MDVFEHKVNILEMKAIKSTSALTLLLPFLVLLLVNQIWRHVCSHIIRYLSSLLCSDQLFGVQYSINIISFAVLISGSLVFCQYCISIFFQSRFLSLYYFYSSFFEASFQPLFHFCSGVLESSFLPLLTFLFLGF